MCRLYLLFNQPCSTTHVDPDWFAQLEISIVLFPLKLGRDEAKKILASEEQPLASGVVYCGLKTSVRALLKAEYVLECYRSLQGQTVGLHRGLCGEA